MKFFITLVGNFLKKFRRFIHMQTMMELSSMQTSAYVMEVLRTLCKSPPLVCLT